MVFHLYIEAHQFKNDVKYVLIVHFPVTSQFVGNVGKHGFQTLKEIVHLSRHDFFHKTLDLVGRLADAHRSIIWQEEFEESLFHLPVGEAQRIVFEHPVVTLDGQVTALIDDGDGIGGSRVDAVQYRLAGHDVFQIFNRKMVQFQQFNQVSRSPCFKPVAAEARLAKVFSRLNGLYMPIAFSVK